MKYKDSYGNKLDASDLGYDHGINGWPFRPSDVTEKDRAAYEKGFIIGRRDFDRRY